MVEKDAQPAVGAAAPIAEGVLDLGLIAGRRAREVVRAHRDRGVAVEVDLVVVEHDLRPSLAAVDRKPAIFGVATLDGIAADKVLHRRLTGWPERELGRLGRLEENVEMAVAVQLGGGLGSGLYVVTSF